MLLLLLKCLHGSLELELLAMLLLVVISTATSSIWMLLLVLVHQSLRSEGRGSLENLFLEEGGRCGARIPSSHGLESIEGWWLLSSAGCCICQKIGKLRVLVSGLKLGVSLEVLLELWWDGRTALLCVL